MTSAGSRLELASERREHQVMPSQQPLATIPPLAKPVNLERFMDAIIPKAISMRREVGEVKEVYLQNVVKQDACEKKIPVLESTIVELSDTNLRNERRIGLLEAELKLKNKKTRTLDRKLEEKVAKLDDCEDEKVLIAEQYAMSLQGIDALVICIGVATTLGEWARGQCKSFTHVMDNKYEELRQEHLRMQLVAMHELTRSVDEDDNDLTTSVEDRSSTGNRKSVVNGRSPNKASAGPEVSISPSNENIRSWEQRVAVAVSQHEQCLTKYLACSTDRQPLNKIVVNGLKRLQPDGQDLRDAEKEVKKGNCSHIGRAEVLPTVVQEARFSR